MPTLTIRELTEIMRECAGEDESVDLSGDIADVDFADLGYDSLALLETAAIIQRRFQIRLEDHVVTEARTPRALVELVNTVLAGASR
ncbi:MAG TPA: acyl carrier protein [Micromonospora sp.]